MKMNTQRKCVGAVLGTRIWIFQKQMVKNIFAASWCLSLNCTALLLKSSLFKVCLREVYISK